MAELTSYPETADILARASTVRTRMADLYHRGCCLSGPDFVALSQELDHLLLPLWHRLQREAEARTADLPPRRSVTPDRPDEPAPAGEASKPPDGDPAADSP